MRIIRLPTVCDKAGIKKSHVYEKIAEGKFPRPVPLGSKARGWIEEEIDKWIASRITERDEGGKAA